MKAGHEFETEEIYEAYLLDYFSGGAMKAELSAQFKDGQVYIWTDADELAKRAYNVAEAMVKERQNRKQT